MPKLFWRSREGAFAPLHAQFTLWPFVGPSLALQPCEILSSLPAPLSPLRTLKREDRPNREQWVELVTQALGEIARGALQKVVLARETMFHLDFAPDPFGMTALLEKRAQGAALFCYQFEDGKAFFGATPERLFRRTKQTILCEAMAGTRKRGVRETELVGSSKDLREFQFVQSYFEEVLRPRCAQPLAFSETHVHHTANVQHLASQATGTLIVPFSDSEIVERLHPSPALCGTPKQKALKWIGAHEPFRRGLYGGILGWQTQEESDWMVSIRSCLLEGSIARIYTGTGIVAGSDPEAEWDELEAKLALYEGAFVWGP